MKINVKFFLFFGSVFLLTSFCYSDDQVLKFKLSILDKGNESIVTCMFSCRDENNDGVIDKNELQEFKETGRHLYAKTIAGQAGGWRSTVDVEKLPPILHTLADLNKFRFSISEYQQGTIVIDYATKTKEYLKVGGYYFMRIVSIEENGKKLTVLSWVGDGTQGLELTMRDSKNLTLKIVQL